MRNMIQHFITNLLNGDYDSNEYNDFRLNTDYTLKTEKNEDGYTVWLEHDGKSIHDFTILSEPQDAYNILSSFDRIDDLTDVLVDDVKKYERDL